MTLHEAVAVANYTERVEIIDVQLAHTAPIALLRSKEMPEYAFVLWVSEKQDTYSQIVFDLENGKPSEQFPVVCACCPSELYGVPRPLLESDEEWNKRLEKLARDYSRAIVWTATMHGIGTLFMRNAKKWTTYRRFINDMPHIAVKEASNFHKPMLDIYGRQSIAQQFRFISAMSQGVHLKARH